MDDIKLPPEFRSGNDIPVERATITRERMLVILQAAIEADRQARGEPVVWPNNAKEIRDFIDVNFISMTADETPSENDKYLLTAHDLLSAFNWWTDFSDQPTKSALQQARNEALDEALNQMCDPIYVEGTINNFAWGTNAAYARAFEIWEDMIRIVRALKTKEQP